MSVVVVPESGRQGSSWQNGWYNGPMPLQEWQMLQHVRRLGAGVRAVRVVKHRTGMYGLREFRVCEVARVQVGTRVDTDSTD